MFWQVHYYLFFRKTIKKTFSTIKLHGGKSRFMYVHLLCPCDFSLVRNYSSPCFPLIWILHQKTIAMNWHELIDKLIFLLFFPYFLTYSLLINNLINILMNIDLYLDNFTLTVANKNKFWGRKIYQFVLFRGCFHSPSSVLFRFSHDKMMFMSPVCCLKHRINPSFHKYSIK